ncbi:flocculation FLO5 [Fusarium beomiforme]|uniref:Flocculation FLO5 n=1 Tax=Fusarium beomiforme TaxID=44412 RepID=A0A9P5ASD4_9HYPO|nr:flocculation FLO5 [Fusarium beomiforme]
MLRISYGDDLAAMWIGTTACGDFEKGNNQTSASWPPGSPGENATYTLQVQAQQYYPIRLIYVNVGGPAVLNLTTTSPSGALSAYYPAPCDGSNAFLPFGTEAQAGTGCTNP